MAEAKQIEGRVLNRIDKTTNWNDSGATPLLPGEIGIGTNDDGKITSLVVGYNVENGEEFDKIIAEGKAFYPGVGAGYTLPNATFNSKGGVKPNADYYTDPDSLDIKGLMWLGAAGFKSNVETLLEREIETVYDNTEDYLRIKTSKPTNALIWGDVYARSITTTKINNQEETDQYITSRLMYLNSDGTYFPDVPGTGIVFMDTEDKDEDGNIDYNTLVVQNNQLTYNNTPFLMLIHENAFEGSRYFKFKTDGSYDILEKIPAADIQDLAGFTLKIDNKTMKYDPINGNTGDIIDVTIPKDYCNEMIINGDSYKPTNNIITLEFPVFTSELQNLIQSAVQEIKINNVVLNKNSNEFFIDGSNTIELESNENRLKINLNSDLESKIKSGVQSITINGEKLEGNDLVYNIEGTDTITVTGVGGKSSVSLNPDYANRVDSAVQSIVLNGETLTKENNTFDIEGSDSINVETTAGKSVITLNDDLKSKIESSADSLIINGVEFSGPQFAFNVQGGSAYHTDGTETVRDTIKVVQDDNTLTLSHYSLDVTHPLVPQTININETNSSVECLLGVTYDNLGHVTNSGRGLLNFKSLLDRIAVLEEKLGIK